MLALCCDYRVMASGPFRIGLNEVQIGLPVPVLAMELARDRLNPAHLGPATLFSRVADPNHALVAGWVDEVVDDSAVVDRATTQAKQLAELPKDAYAKTKLALRERTVAYIRETLTRDFERLIPAG